MGDLQPAEAASRIGGVVGLRNGTGTARSWRGDHWDDARAAVCRSKIDCGHPVENRGPKRGDADGGLSSEPAPRDGKGRSVAASDGVGAQEQAERASLLLGGVFPQ